MKWILLSIIVLATVLADLLQSYEMKRSGEQKINARGLGRLVRTIAERRFLLFSIFCMAVSFFAFMALVQREPLSFAVPASAATFVCETILAKFVLNEAVGKRRTAGALLVLSGVVLLAH
jgi:drug/metabolite transporter (DMT)-like permease